MDTSNPVEILLKNHRSIRKFEPIPVTDDQLVSIVQAAQAASTSSNVQAYTVIAVRDPAKRAKLAELTGNQTYVEHCGIFLVWCADLHRIQVAVETVQNGHMEADLLEPFVVATIDVALAAENAIVAAESMGLGGVFIGGIRNRPAEVSQLLRLPQLVYPAFGMCLGVPAQQPSIRPRFSVETVLHQDEYEEHRILAGIASYDEVMDTYYQKRGRPERTSWSIEMKHRFSRRVRADLKSFLESQGFAFQ